MEPFKPIPTFKGVAEAAEHFKRIHEARILQGVPGDLAGVGEQCVLTDGPKDHPGDRLKQVRNSFRLKGVRVRSEGPHGNRIVTVRGFAEEYVRRDR